MLAAAEEDLLQNDRFCAEKKWRAFQTRRQIEDRGDAAISERLAGGNDASRTADDLLTVSLNMRRIAEIRRDQALAVAVAKRFETERTFSELAAHIERMAVALDGTVVIVETQVAFKTADQ